MKNKHYNEYKKSINKLIIDPLVDVAVAERPHTNLGNAEHFKQRVKAQLINSIDQYQKMMTDAILILETHAHKHLAERLQKVYAKAGKEAFWQNENSIDSTIQDLVGISDEEIISYYNVGSQLFKSGAYHDACHIFTLLTQLNPKATTFWMALAIAQEKLHEYEIAVYSYLISAELDETSTTCYLHAARCLVQLHQPEEAKKVLQHALERINEQPNLKSEQAKINNMLNSIGK